MQRWQQPLSELMLLATGILLLVFISTKAWQWILR